jgi:CMP-N-acetylneuraminic acid synthetase
MHDKPVCIIPARGGSKRFPRKNVALLAGKPLLVYAIETALDSGVFDQVYVSSEDDEILAIARQFGESLALRRPAELAGDRVQLKQVCAYLLSDWKEQGRPYTEFALLVPTNPLRTAQDVRDAYTVFREAGGNYLMSLVEHSHPPQMALWSPHGFLEPYFGRQYIRQSQQLEKLYRHDGSIIFARTEIFLEEVDMGFYGTKVVPYVIPASRSVDIDNPLDLEWAEFLLARASQESSLDNKPEPS